MTENVTQYILHTKCCFPQKSSGPLPGCFFPGFGSLPWLFSSEALGSFPWLFLPVFVFFVSSFLQHFASCYRKRIIRMNEGGKEFRHDLSALISKMVIRMVRHRDQDERDHDGAVRWDTMIPKLLKAFGKRKHEISRAKIGFNTPM